MPTLILTPRYTDDSQALWRAAIDLGWDVERLTRWDVPAHLLEISEPVLYLEALMAPLLAEQFKLRLLEPPEDWLPQLPKPYRQRSIHLQTLEQAKQLNTTAFIKPPNDKSFPARIYSSDELPDGYPDETPVLISEIVQWKKEFRCFILNRTLKTFSIYLREGVLQRQQGFAHTPEEEQELLEFVNTVLADDQVQLPVTAVLDVGIIQNRGWAVVEQNAAWGAGIYGCDPMQVLEVLRYAAVPA